MKLLEIQQAHAIDPNKREEIEVSGHAPQGERQGAHQGVDQAKLSEQIFKFANKLRTQNPQEFQKLLKLVQQESQRRGLA